jgi:hypothetical protein
MATSQNAPDTFFQGDIPGGDISFDELFSPEQTLTNPQPQVADPENDPPKTQPQAAPAPPESFELKTSTGSVYKSKEDAIKGIEEKDTLLEKLRQEYILKMGVDPITHKPVNFGAGRGEPQADANYLQDKRKYVKDLEDAVKRNDPEAYANAQIKLLTDTFAPLGPVINDLARERAVQSVSADVAEFAQFRKGDDYKKVLEINKTLGSAIEAAENNYTMHNQLPELYRIAYFVSQGQRVPDLIKQATQATALAAQPTQPTRPSTMTPSAMTPPNVSNQPTDLSTREGRQQYIKQFKDSGGESWKF